ncbi:MAG TPA: hypothetical protein VIG32_06630 [Candidatus Baltobacteraceae bacterium]
MYHGISATIQFGAPTSGSGPVQISDALNNGDISPNTLPADNATSGATPIFYISIYNANSTEIDINSTPAVTVTDSNGFGSATACTLDSYNNGAWKNTQVPSAAPSGTSVTFPASTLGKLQITANAQQIVALSCK